MTSPMTSPQNNNPQKQFNYAPALEELAQLFGSRLKTAECSM